MEYSINFNFHGDKEFNKHSDVLYFKANFEIYTEIKTNERQLHKVIILHNGYCILGFVDVLILQKKI